MRAAWCIYLGCTYLFVVHVTAVVLTAVVHLSWLFYKQFRYCCNRFHKRHVRSYTGNSASPSNTIRGHRSTSTLPRDIGLAMQRMQPFRRSPIGGWFWRTSGTNSRRQRECESCSKMSTRCTCLVSRTLYGTLNAHGWHRFDSCMTSRMNWAHQANTIWLSIQVNPCSTLLPDLRKVGSK